MSKKEIWRAIEAATKIQDEMKIPYISLYLTEKERFVPRLGQITVHEVMRMFSTTLISAAEALHWTPIKILSKFGEVMQEQVDEIDRRTKAIDKSSPKAALKAKRSGVGR